jgi:hypothetical protein
MSLIQLGPVKTRFIGGASWPRGRDAQIGLIKNKLRPLCQFQKLRNSLLSFVKDILKHLKYFPANTHVENFDLFQVQK